MSAIKLRSRLRQMRCQLKAVMRCRRSRFSGDGLARCRGVVLDLWRMRLARAALPASTTISACWRRTAMAARRPRFTMVRTLIHPPTCPSVPGRFQRIRHRQRIASPAVSALSARIVVDRPVRRREKSDLATSTPAESAGTQGFRHQRAEQRSPFRFVGCGRKSLQLLRGNSFSCLGESGRRHQKVDVSNERRFALLR